MARTGRPPKPVEVKRRTGNPGRRPLPVAVKDLSPATRMPAPPAPMGKAGQALWESVWVHAQAWISPDLDLGTVGLTALTWDFIEECRVQIAKDGLLLEEPIVSPNGVVVGSKWVAHPLIKEQRAAEKQLLSLLSVLALTPTDRARLGLAQVKQQSVLEKLIDARSQSPAPTAIRARSRTA